MFTWAGDHHLLLLLLPSPTPKSMEKHSPAAPYHSFVLTDPIALLLYKTLPLWFLLLHKLSLRLLSLLRSSHDGLCASKIDVDGNQPGNGHDNAREGLELTREDVEVVMEAMGLHGSERVEKSVAGTELAVLFDDKEPSLEEVEAAFQVFDEGRDGFIDAAELRSALGKLGFVEGKSLDACAQMIAAYDENKDGRIDFDEFVKFMESSFC